MGTPAPVEVDDTLVVLELLDRRKKPVRLERPPTPALLPLTPPEKAPPPPLGGCGPEACRVGYNLAAVEPKEEGECVYVHMETDYTLCYTIGTIFCTGQLVTFGAKIVQN